MVSPAQLLNGIVSLQKVTELPSSDFLIQRGNWVCSVAEFALRRATELPGNEPLQLPCKNEFWGESNFLGSGIFPSEG